MQNYRFCYIQNPYFFNSAFWNLLPLEHANNLQINKIKKRYEIDPPYCTEAIVNKRSTQ